MYRISAFAFGLLAYASFGLSLLYLLGFLMDLGELPVTVDRGPSAPAWTAGTVDTLLIAAFGLQHSIMARPGFKRAWTRLVPPSIERSVYVLISSAGTLLLCAAWRPIPQVVWSAAAGIESVLWWGGFAAGFVVLIAASFQIDHFELLGLKQTWSALRGRPCARPAFSVRGLYKLVRHPIYVGWLLLFSAAPRMTVGHLLLAAGMTVYVLVAMTVEERDLVRDHGDAYLGYRKRVPALLPRLVPVPDADARARDAETRTGAGEARTGGSETRTGAGEQAVRRLVRSVLLGVTIAAASVVTTAKADGVTHEMAVESGGRTRTALVYLSAPDAAPTRLVLMLHGAGGSAERIRRFTGHGLERNAAAGEWAVVYPEGVNGTWNDCRRTPPYAAKRLGVDDVGFLVDLIARLRERYSLDVNDVLVAGFSNGGQMAIRLALERPDALGALAVAAAQLPTPSESVCAEKAPALDSLWIKGTADPFLPSAGGDSKGAGGESLGPVVSIRATIAAFLEALPNAAPLPPRTLAQTDGDPSTAVVLEEWRSPRGPLLRSYTLKGSGHVLPQAEAGFPPVVGRAARDADFGDIVLDFLAAVASSG
jgi:poly(3-hydroxybutyrate) depolymerase/protein-S-isoprenylcysteine O-methyltransferase Ste14